VRLFVAAELPAPARDELAAWGRAWVQAGGWRAVPPESLHLTLAFLGERPEEDVPRIAAVLPGAVTPVGVAELGDAVLLPPRRPRVSAVRLLERDGGRLAALQASVSDALVALGVFEPEKRRFLPHVTVARRARGDAGNPDGPRWRTGPFALPAVVLYRSRLSPRGASYEALASVPLALEGA
jgi:2'-5' RNA ligase